MLLHFVLFDLCSPVCAANFGGNGIDVLPPHSACHAAFLPVYFFLLAFLLSVMSCLWPAPVYPAALLFASIVVCMSALFPVYLPAPVCRLVPLVACLSICLATLSLCCSPCCLLVSCLLVFGCLSALLPALVFSASLPTLLPAVLSACQPCCPCCLPNYSAA